MTLKARTSLALVECIGPVTFGDISSPPNSGTRKTISAQPLSHSPLSDAERGKMYMCIAEARDVGRAVITDQTFA